MNILAFDPGHKTGIAILSDGEVTLLLTVDYSWIFARDFLHSLVRISEPDQVVVEALPAHNADTLTASVYARIMDFFVASHKLSIIPPSTWKPVMEQVKLFQSDYRLKDHAMDALGLARYSERTATSGVLPAVPSDPGSPPGNS